MWEIHPVTLNLKGHIETLIKEFQDQWASGDFTSATSDGTVQLNARMIGFVHGLLTVNELSFEDLGEGNK